ncbi:MAG: heavy-metal-associated domain-containing protein, partial [Candidatus Eremiobacteraeota bacterium]|nr:heavy-metal-associated domain-containing protein [Candidatus Eremiobacteraeota bacterium]
MQTSNRLLESGATAAFALRGMSCASCAAAIENRLRRERGVTSATVNLATERASVHFDPAASSPAAIISAVEDAGYEAELLSA